MGLLEDLAAALSGGLDPSDEVRTRLALGGGTTTGGGGALEGLLAPYQAAISGAPTQIAPSGSQDTLMGLLQGQGEQPGGGGGAVGGGGPISFGDLTPENLVTRRGVTLQAPAMRTLLEAQQRFGHVFPAVTDSYRTMAQQRALYAQKPGLAAPPGQSLHQQGLAIDAGALSNAVSRWLLQHGWNQFSPQGEPWHYSYRKTG